MVQRLREEGYVEGTPQWGYTDYNELRLSNRGREAYWLFWRTQREEEEKIASSLLREVQDAHEQKEFRPVAVAVIYDALGRVFVVQSAKNMNDWLFPQGGIEQDENIINALYREVNEEVGLWKDQLRFLSYCGSADLAAEPGRKDKRGFVKGKRYFFFKLFYSGTGKIILQKGELAGHKWIYPHDMKDALDTTRAEKRALMLQFI